jgi:hypothetical protein
VRLPAATKRKLLPEDAPAEDAPAEVATTG